MDVSEVHRVVDTSLNTASLLFNGYLLYLVKRHSTFQVPVYQRLLAVDAGLDFALALMILIAQPVYTTAEGFMVLLCNGFFAQRSLLLDSVILNITVLIVHINVLWIPIQFAYRYAFLCLRDERRMRLNRIISTFAVVWNIVAFFVFIAMLKPSAEFQPQGLRVLEMNSWPIGNKTSANSAVFGAHISSPRLIAWEVLWFVSSIGGAVVVFRCEIMIVGHFRRHGSFQHEKTRRMHQEFHRALLAMAVCPIITTAIPISYFIVTIGLSLCPGPISAFLSTATSSITAFNPLTTILFMRCYRQAFLRTFRCLRWEVRTAPVTGVTDFTGLERAGRAVGR